MRRGRAPRPRGGGRPAGCGAAGRERADPLHERPRRLRQTTTDSADLFLADVSGIVSVQPTFTPAAGQHRHGTWSPDRTKVAYARGTPGSFLTEAFDIYVHDLDDGHGHPDSRTRRRPHRPTTRLVAGRDEDRLRGGGRPNNGSARHLGRGRRSSGGPHQHHPSRGRRAQAGMDPSLVGQSTSTSAIRPWTNALNVDKRARRRQRRDGDRARRRRRQRVPGRRSRRTDRRCARRRAAASTARPDHGRPRAPARGRTWSTSATTRASATTTAPGRRRATRSCTSRGRSQSGVLMRAEWPDTEIEFPVTDDTSNFDGNPDWAPDGRPTCPDLSATVVQGQSVSVPVECTDTGPAYEQSEAREFLGNDTAVERHGHRGGHRRPDRLHPERRLHRRRLVRLRGVRQGRVRRGRHDRRERHGAARPDPRPGPGPGPVPDRARAPVPS